MKKLMEKLNNKIFKSTTEEEDFYNKGVRFEVELSKILERTPNAAPYWIAGDFEYDGVHIQAKLQNGSLSNPKDNQQQGLTERINNEKSILFMVGIKHRKDLIVYIIKKDKMIELAEDKGLKLFREKLTHNKVFGYRLAFTINGFKGYSIRKKSCGSFKIENFHI